VVLTHWNGLHVGNLVLQQERVSETPELPLDAPVAETQAQIGYSLDSGNRAVHGAEGVMPP
jgi:carbamate kinase